MIGEFSTSYLENSWDKGNKEFSKANPIKNLHVLWKYLPHLFREAQELSIPGNPFCILLPEQFCDLTLTWSLQDSNQNTSSVSNTGYRGLSKQDSRYESNQSAYQLLAFKKGITTEVSQYTILKETTCLNTMMIVRNYSNKRKCYKVISAKP